MIFTFFSFCCERVKNSFASAHLLHRVFLWDFVFEHIDASRVRKYSLCFFIFISLIFFLFCEAMNN